MKKFILLILFASFLLIQAVKASDVISCAVNPQEVNMATSNQVTVTVQLNNTQNVTGT